MIIRMLYCLFVFCSGVTTGINMILLRDVSKVAYDAQPWKILAAIMTGLAFAYMAARSRR